MKRLWLLIFVSSVFVLTGCIEVTTVINVNPDGSGTIDETLLMGKEVVAMISEFTGAFAEDTSGTAEKFSLFNESEIREKAGQYGTGVKYMSGKELNIDGKEGYMVTYSFSDISKLTIDQNPGNKLSFTPSGDTVEAEKENISFAFQKGTPSVLTINLPDTKSDEQQDQIETLPDTTMTESADSTAFDQVVKMMEGLKISVMLNVNGSIVESNATHANGSVITLMNLSFAELLKDPAKLNELKSINPSNIEQLKEVLTSIPGIQMELNKQVTVKFK